MFWQWSLNNRSLCHRTKIQTRSDNSRITEGSGFTRLRRWNVFRQDANVRKTKCTKFYASNCSLWSSFEVDGLVYLEQLETKKNRLRKYIKNFLGHLQRIDRWMDSYPILKGCSVDDNDNTLHKGGIFNLYRVSSTIKILLIMTLLFQNAWWRIHNFLHITSFV